MNIHKEITPMRRALITLTVMAATLMQVLDTTIVNVALPHMQGSLGATSDQITWVLTSYLVASAIFMPLTGYFTDTLGQKKYLLISIGGFVLSSILCGAAQSIAQIVVFRLMQGVFGAALVPLSQSIMTDIFPEEERGTAMAIWGVGVMVGPILGPTLGGYLTDMANWRWNFYINVPVGILCLIFASRYISDTPKKERSMDWPGLALISVSIGALQYFLDRGNEDDWFSARGICIAAFLTVICFLGFMLHNLGNNSKKIVFDLKIFSDRNFAISSFLLALFGLGLYGAMVILPQLLEGLLNYPVVTTGMVMAPRGVSSMVSMMLVGKLIKKYDARLIVMSGIIISSIGMYFGTYYNTSIDKAWIIGPIILQGFGLGMVFVPLATVAFSTLPASMRGEASGLYSLLRTLGSSIGISIVATLFARHTQMAWNQLGGFITPYNTAVPAYLASVHQTATSPLGAAILGHTIASQAQMLSFVDIYAFITFSFILMLPFLLLLKNSNQRDVPVESFAEE